MTTLTKEQLIERCKSQADYAQAIIDLYPDDVGAAESRRIAEIALASLEAPAVMYASQETLDAAEQGEHLLRTLSKPSGDAVIPLYSAPPAPVPMKDHQIRELVNELRDIAVDYHATQQLRERIARAVRAAMQGKAEPVSQPYKLPYGYAVVPVEPTAKMISSGIAAHYERSQVQIHDRPAPGPMECAYVAMLAAAPQQEVKP